MRCLALLSVLFVCGCQNALDPLATGGLCPEDASIAPLFIRAETEEIVLHCIVKEIVLRLLPPAWRQGVVYHRDRVLHIQDGAHLLCGPNANWDVQMEILSDVRESPLEGVQHLHLHVESPARLFRAARPEGERFYLTLIRHTRTDGLVWFTLQRTPAACVSHLDPDPPAAPSP